MSSPLLAIDHLTSDWVHVKGKYFSIEKRGCLENIRLTQSTVYETQRVS